MAGSRRQVVGGGVNSFRETSESAARLLARSESYQEFDSRPPVPCYAECSRGLTSGFWRDSAGGGSLR